MPALRLLDHELPERLRARVARRVRSKMFAHAHLEMPEGDEPAERGREPEGEGSESELQARVEAARRWMEDLRGRRRPSDRGQA